MHIKVDGDRLNLFLDPRQATCGRRGGLVFVVGYAQAAGAVVGCSSAYGRYSTEPLRAHGRFVDARVDYNIYINI